MMALYLKKSFYKKSARLLSFGTQLYSISRLQVENI